jgi:hypothetical protein
MGLDLDTNVANMCHVLLLPKCDQFLVNLKNLATQFQAC